jgi:hypothetical protein
MLEITYIGDENILQIARVRGEAVEYIVHVACHMVSFVSDKPCTYFLAISLIASRHGSFIRIIRANIRPVRICAVNERRLVRIARRISFSLSRRLAEGNRSPYFPAA